MNLQISSDNMDLTESMKTLVEQKLQRLDRLWEHLDDDTVSMRVVLNSAPEDTFLAKLNANVDGNDFFADSTGFELETALVDAISELDRAYIKHKEKLTDRNWEENRENKILTEDDLENMIESQEQE